eukprot:5709781-Alexandrium_andersonii.AAC.1
MAPMKPAVDLINLLLGVSDCLKSGQSYLRVARATRWCVPCYAGTEVVKLMMASARSPRVATRPRVGLDTLLRE